MATKSLSPLLALWSNMRTYVTDSARNVTWLKKWGRRDFKRRQLVAQYADERLRLKMLKKTKMLPSSVIAQAKEDMKKLPLDSNICRVRNRCIMTDRGRSVITCYKIGRHKFKKYADEGLLSGVTKSSW